jgi:hypothetical protein
MTAHVHEADSDAQIFACTCAFGTNISHLCESMSNYSASPYARLEKAPYRLRRPSVATPSKYATTVGLKHEKKPSVATRARTKQDKHLAILLVVLLVAIVVCFAFAYYLYSET